MYQQLYVPAVLLSPLLSRIPVIKSTPGHGACGLYSRKANSGTFYLHCCKGTVAGETKSHVGHVIYMSCHVKCTKSRYIIDYKTVAVSLQIVILL